jgi:hypothetical protein
MDDDLGLEELVHSAAWAARSRHELGSCDASIGYVSKKVRTWLTKASWC